MTDKDIKDYCKNCDVEPPAMRFKCPECEHNTDKEQIIIDGVEVLKEKINMCFILLLDKLETPETIEQTIYEHLDAFVKEWNTQLARKTQEYESLKQEIEILQNNFDTATRDCNEIVAELENECEQLKKANLHIDTNRQCKGKKLKRIEDLISACEAGYTDEFIQKIYGIIQEPEPTINDYSITDRYRKALEEIEEVIKSPCAEDCVYYEYSKCYDCIKTSILYIINKAKGR